MKKIKINESKILPPVLHKNNIIQCFKLKKMKIDNNKNVSNPNERRDIHGCLTYRSESHELH